MLFSSFQFSSVAQSCPTFCSPMDCSMLGFPVHHQFAEPTQTHVHHVGDAIYPSHPLLSPSPPTFNLSQHQGLFQWVSSSHQVVKVLEFGIHCWMMTNIEFSNIQWVDTSWWISACIYYRIKEMKRHFWVMVNFLTYFLMNSNFS